MCSMHTHSYANALLCIRTSMHTHSYAYALLCICTPMHTHSYAYAVLCIRTPMHTHSYAYSLLCIRTPMHTHSYAYALLCIRTPMHTHSYAHALLRIRTPMHMHSYAYSLLCIRTPMHKSDCMQVISRKYMAYIVNVVLVRSVYAPYSLLKLRRTATLGECDSHSTARQLPLSTRVLLIFRIGQGCHVWGARQLHGQGCPYYHTSHNHD